MGPIGQETAVNISREQIAQAAMRERLKRYRAWAVGVLAGLVTAAALVYDYATLHARVDALEARHERTTTAPAAPEKGSSWWPWGKG